jgi:hypothetical protein
VSALSGVDSLTLRFGVAAALFLVLGFMSETVSVARI